jgi:hypothetical protein
VAHYKKHPNTNAFIRRPGCKLHDDLFDVSWISRPYQTLVLVFQRNFSRNTHRSIAITMPTAP